MKMTCGAPRVSVDFPCHRAMKQQGRDVLEQLAVHYDDKISVPLGMKLVVHPSSEETEYASELW